MEKLYINWPAIELSSGIYREDILPKLKFAIENELRNPEWHKKLGVLAKEVFERVLEKIENEESMIKNMEKLKALSEIHNDPKADILADMIK